MKTLTMKVLGSFLVLSLTACGGMEAEPEETAPAEREVSAQVVMCYAYLLDGPNFTGASLAPWPVTGTSGTCVNVAATSDNRTSSFRLANCYAVFYDGPNCTGSSYASPTSGNMPAFFDNRTTSVFFP
jgi:hypothetical protein